MDYERDRDRWRWENDWREREEREEPPVRYPDPLMGARWGTGRRHGFGRWGVGWGTPELRRRTARLRLGRQLAGGSRPALSAHPPRRRTRGFRRASLGTLRRSRAERLHPDERIREDVSDHLWSDPWIDASEMTVLVKDGEVTLEGTVEDRFAKRLAEDIAEGCVGVKDVHNRLRIAPNRGGAETISPLENNAAGFADGGSFFIESRIGVKAAASLAPANEDCEPRPLPSW